MINQGLLMVVSGPSGAGKGTVCRRYMEKFLQTTLSISATTRPPREGEIDGVNYHFLKREVFEEMIDQGEFLEWAEVYGNYYGTPKKNIIKALNKGIDVILEIDIQGAMQVKNKYPEGVFVFILPPSYEVLRQRLIGRKTDSPEVIERRLSCAASEIEKVCDYNYGIINDNIDQAIKELEAIVVAEKLTTCRNEFIIT
jgi:guanylate kinase